MELTVKWVKKEGLHINEMNMPMTWLHRINLLNLFFYTWLTGDKCKHFCETGGHIYFWYGIE